MSGARRRRRHRLFTFPALPRLEASVHSSSVPGESFRFRRGRGLWLRLAALWLGVIAGVLLARLGYIARGPLIGVVIFAAWMSAIALGSGGALRGALRMSSLMDRIHSWRPATRAVLAIFIGVGAVILGNVITR